MVAPDDLWFLEKDKRKLSRDAKQYVRQVGSVLIVFWAKDTIYVVDDRQKFIIHRWFDARRNYRGWHNLCNSLKRRNSLSGSEICAMARRHGFSTCGFSSLPKGIEKIVKLKEKYQWRKKS